MPKPPKPKIKSPTTASTTVKVENYQPVLVAEDYIQLKIEGIDFSSLELDRKSLTSDIAVDLVAFEPVSKTTTKPKKRKYSWWELHPSFAPNTEVDLLHFHSQWPFGEVSQDWYSGYWVYDPDRKKASQPDLLTGGQRPVGISIHQELGKVVFYPVNQVRVHVPGTPHYSKQWQNN